MTPNFDREANRRAAWRWGSLVVGLLTLQVAIGVVALVVATGDGSADVIPNYYQKSLDWDEAVALRRASEDLGWQLKLDATENDGQLAGLVLQMTDQDGIPVRIASGQLQWFRHARAAEVRSVSIPNHPGGLFTIDACFDAGGLWQIIVDVTDAAGNRYLDSRELDLTPPSHAADSGAT